MYHIAVTLLHHIPEGMLILYVGFFLTRVQRSAARIAVLGTAYGVGLAVARALFSMGYHLPLMIGLLFCLNYWGGRLSLARAAFATAGSILAIALGSVLVAFPVMMQFQVDYEGIRASIPLSLLGSWLEDVFLCLLALFAYRFGHRVRGVADEGA